MTAGTRIGVTREVHYEALTRGFVSRQAAPPLPNNPSSGNQPAHISLTIASTTTPNAADTVNRTRSGVPKTRGHHFATTT